MKTIIFQAQNMSRSALPQLSDVRRIHLTMTAIH